MSYLEIVKSVKSVLNRLPGEVREQENPSRQYEINELNEINTPVPVQDAAGDGFGPGDWDSGTLADVPPGAKILYSPDRSLWTWVGGYGWISVSSCLPPPRLFWGGLAL
jgi:hypothetical protein